MKPWAREWALGLMLSAALPALAAYAADPAEQILLDKANFWRLKDRPDLAMDALGKLLTLNPSQPDALYQYGLLEVQRGNIGAAQRYLTRLQQVAPSSPRLADLQNSIRAGQVSTGELNEARRLAQSGQFAQATQKYQQTFKGPPPPTFGVEYYLTEAGTPQGWEDARSGLEHLAQSSPNDPKVKLALAQVYTYRDATRRDGVEQLARLRSDPVVGTQASQAWRQSLMWLGGGPRDKQLYDEYLTQYPQDSVIRQHMTEVTRTGAVGGNPIDAARTEGYADLQRGNTAAAERAFQATLRARPGDAEALGGLGIIRLRQQRFGEARDMLGRAMRASPGQQGKWAAAYDSASFYAALNEAKAARDAGNLDRARTLLNGLASRSRNDGWSAELVLGDVDSRLGDHAAAEQAYRRVLAVRPDDADANVGLFNELTAQGKTAEAATLASRVNLSDRGRLAGANRMRAEVLRADAKSSEVRGDATQAMTKYQQAIATDPADPWARLDFARFLVRQGQTTQAFAIVDPAASGNTPASLQAAAIFDSEQSRSADALAKIDRIPPGSRTPDIQAFRERILTVAEIDRAKQLARAGNRAEARNVLISLYSRPPTTPDKSRLIADALSEIGDTDRALQIARESVARGGAGSTQATIDYTGLLLKSGRDAEATAYIAQLESSGRLSVDERRELENLKANVAANRSDIARKRGDLAGAYDQVSPLLNAYPNNPTLLLATGRLYAAAGQTTEAMRFFDAAYQQNPNDLETIRGAVGGAVAAHDLSRARAYLDHGMQLYPNNPRLYFLAAEIARAGGDTGTAMRALQTARALDVQQSGGGAEALPGRPMMPGAPSSLPPNPFRRSQSSALPSDFEPASFGTAPESTPAYAPPSVASAAPSQSDVAPAAPSLAAAAPADSDDLTVPPHVRERPPRPVAMSSSPRQTAEGRVAVQRQVAELQSAQTYANEMPASDLDPTAGVSPAGVQTADTGLSSGPDPNYAPRATQVAQVEQLEPLPPPPVQGYQPPSFARPNATTVPQDSLELDIQRSMASIEAENNPTVEGGLALRGRTGEDGLSRLIDVGIPVDATFSPFYTGTVRVAATPTFLSAGAADANSALRFGTNPLLALATGGIVALPGDQNASGVALSAGYSLQNFAGEIGTTPLGFPVTNITGRVALAFPGSAGNATEIRYSDQYDPRVPSPIALAPQGTPPNPFQVRVEGTRQPITDSVLSYAGTKDPLTGTVWGGVVKTGGDILASYDDGDVGFYGTGGGGVLDGKHVASNTEIEGSVGAFVRPYRAGTDSFKVGVNLTYLNFDKNLDFFTLGQGGYFSPQNYLNFSVPLEYSGRSGRLTYLAAGAIGVQTFDEKSSPLFPVDPGFQAAAQRLVPPFVTANFASQSKTGASFNLRGQLEYQLNNGFSVGGLASIDNSEDFTEGIAKIYLRKTFGISGPTGVLPNTRPGSL